MHSDRRLLLKSLAAAGLAISGAGWTQLATAANAPAAAAAAGDMLALTSSLSATAKDAALNEAFLSGVRTGARTVSHTAVQGLDSAPFQQLGQMLADGQSTVLVGLLDDASATQVKGWPDRRADLPQNEFRVVLQCRQYALLVCAHLAVRLDESGWKVGAFQAPRGRSGLAGKG